MNCINNRASCMLKGLHYHPTGGVVNRDDEVTATAAALCDVINDLKEELAAAGKRAERWEGNYRILRSQLDDATVVAQDRLTALRAAEADAKRLRRGIDAVQVLINESRGVVGLHLNGDEAPWDELLAGGRFEEWLREFSAAVSSPAGGEEVKRG